MDETIGVKGGHNDYKRRMLITLKQKKKLQKIQEEEEIKKLEKEVKRKTRYSLIKTLPFVVSLGTLKVFYDNSKKVKDDSEKKIIIVEKEKEKTINIKTKIDIPKNIVINLDKKSPKKEERKEEERDKDKDKEKEKKQNIKIENVVSFEELNENNKEKLNKLKTRKIIDVYEKELKDIRYELRELEFEYNNIDNEAENIVYSDETDKILSKLSSIIDKLEELKSKIKIENLDKYDDNYIYTLIEEYLSEFKDKKFISEIKDSDIYILISKKIEELDNKKDSLLEKVNNKKEELSVKEVNFEKLKDKYSNIEKYSESIDDFYRKQEELLKEMQSKIDNAVSVSEKVEIEYEFIHKNSKNLLKKLAMFMFLPGVIGARILSKLTKSFTNNTTNVLDTRKVERKYKVVDVKDYSDNIKNSIETIDNVSDALSKSTYEIDKLISKVKEDYKDKE